MIDGVEIYGEADMIFYEQELDHATAVKEVGCVAHREGIGRGENREIFAEMVAFVGADEDDRAAFGLGYIGDAANVYG